MKEFTLSYIVFLHQTTTQMIRKCHNQTLSYIVFLHQTTTVCAWGAERTRLSYIVFLHQTTTRTPHISSAFPIVLYRLSTSNHNLLLHSLPFLVLSYIVFLHQTTTRSKKLLRTTRLSYIVFLHQTTTISLF